MLMFSQKQGRVSTGLAIVRLSANVPHLLAKPSLGIGQGSRWSRKITFLCKLGSDALFGPHSQGWKKEAQSRVSHLASCRTVHVRPQRIVGLCTIPTW